MIKLYRLNNLEETYAEIPISEGYITSERNGANELSFSLPIKYLRENNIIIDCNTVFKVERNYYISKTINKSDVSLTRLKIEAELLITHILFNKFINEISFENATIKEIMEELLKDTICIVGECENIKTDYKIEKTNLQAGLNQLLELTQCEIKYDNLTINVKQNVEGIEITELKKGIDMTIVNEETDITNVITRLHYCNSNGIQGTVDSNLIKNYDVIKEGYKELEGNSVDEITNKAKEYLNTVDKPVCNVTITIHKQQNPKIKLCKIVKINNSVINTDLEFKIIKYTKDLITGEIRCELGQRKKDLVDIQQMLLYEVKNSAKETIINEITNVVQNEVINVNTMHSLNAWIKNLYVNYVETNFDALDVRIKAPKDNMRHYIKIKEEEQLFISAKLSETETEYLQIPNPQNINEKIYVYYTAIDNHKDAYKYFTITNPKEIYSDITDAQIDAFKVKVRKTIEEATKMQINFEEIPTNNGATIVVPLISLGAGTGYGENGRAYIYKDIDELKIKYYDGKYGEIREISLNDNGIKLYGGSVVEGERTEATGEYSHAEGFNTQASGGFSHAQGDTTIASGLNTHAEGWSTIASGNNSHAEGGYTEALGDYSHSEGLYSKAIKDYTHAEGYYTEANNEYSHAEGMETKANGYGSHAEGSNTITTGDYSHAEGESTEAKGAASHSEGCSTIAQGCNSHAGGCGTIANADNQYAIGRFNKKNNSLFIIGNGYYNSRENAFYINEDGNTKSDGTFSSSGADYAELFEWLDGNPQNEDRVGCFVTLESEKIKIANSKDDYILGVVSSNPSIIGDEPLRWRKKFKTDEWGRIQYETVKEIKEYGEVEIIRPIINEKFDQERNESYEQRTNRQEWDAIGMLGKLRVRDDGTCKVNGYCAVSNNGIATSSNKGYRVMKRIADNIILILFR